MATKGIHGKFIRTHNIWSLNNFNDGFISKDGRMFVLLPNHHRAHKTGFVLRSIVAYEAYTGDIVSRDYVIHHINSNKLDDSEGNLLKIKFGRHSSLHSNYCGELRKCKTCGQDFHAPLYRLNEKNARRGQYCSRECHYKGRSIK
jgi:hypothetical protein